MIPELEDSLTTSNIVIAAYPDLGYTEYNVELMCSPGLMLAHLTPSTVGIGPGRIDPPFGTG